MRIINIVSLILGMIIVLYFSWKLSAFKYKKYTVVVFSLLLQLIYRFVESIYITSFLHSVVASRIFVPVTLVIENISLVGIFIGITYLFVILCFDLISLKRGIGYAVLFVGGSIIGLSLPKVIFYISEYRIYNWLPDYSPVGEQFKGGLIIGFSILVFLVIACGMLFSRKYKLNRKYISISIMLSILIGSSLQLMDIGMFPDLFMGIFF